MADDRAASPDDCPLCGEANACVMAAEGGGGASCWCTHSTFSAELLASVPRAAQGKACICRSCAAKGVAPQASRDRIGQS